jgi:hypothetical protein
MPRFDGREALRAFRIFLVLLGAAALLAGAVSASRAHDHGPGSWINNEKLTDPQTGEWCCNLVDCREENVTPVDGGYLVETGEVIPQKRVIWRSPGSWWRCRYMSGAQEGQTRCLIGPPQGS